MRHTHRNGLPALRLEADSPAIATRRPARVGPAPKPCMSVIRFPVSPAAGPRASACLGGRYGRALTINRHDSDLKRTELVISSASHGTRIRLRVERRRRRRVVPRSGGHLGFALHVPAACRRIRRGLRTPDRIATPTSRAAGGDIDDRGTHPRSRRRPRGQRSRAADSGTCRTAGDLERRTATGSPSSPVAPPGGGGVQAVLCPGSGDC